MRQTNPICSLSQVRLNVAWNGSYERIGGSRVLKKQSQFPCYGRVARDTHGRSRPCCGTPYGVTTNRAAAPNEANLRAGVLEHKCRADKELRGTGCGSGPGKTKPRCGSRWSVVGWRSNCVKRSQFREPGQADGALHPRGNALRRYYEPRCRVKRTQFPRRGRVSWYSSTSSVHSIAFVRNEPNCLGGGLDLQCRHRVTGNGAVRNGW
jgi:hypothetical protein